MAEPSLFLPKNSASSATPSGNGHDNESLHIINGRGGTSKHISSSWRFHIKKKCRKVFVKFGSCSSGESEVEDRTKQTSSGCGMPSAIVPNADSEVKMIEMASRLGATSANAHSIQDRKSEAIGSGLIDDPIYNVHAAKSVRASTENSTRNAGLTHNGSSNIEQKHSNISKLIPQWHMSAIMVIRGFYNMLSALLCLLIDEVSNGGQQVANAGVKFPSDKEFEVLHALLTVHGIVLAPVSFAIQQMGFVSGILRSFERKGEGHFRVTSAPRRSGGVNPNIRSDKFYHEKLDALIAVQFIVLAPVLALQQMWI